MTDSALTRGEMTSATWLRLVREGAERRLGQTLGPTRTGKAAILRGLCERCGLAAAFDLGLDVRQLPPHPLLSAVTRASTPIEIIQRWLRVERFGHSRNRTKIEEANLAQKWVTMHHYAIDGGPIDVRSDLFVWGMFVGLWALGSVRGATVELRDARGPVGLHVQQSDAVLGGPTIRSARAVLRWESHDAQQHASRLDEVPQVSSVAARLCGLLAEDLVHGWKVAEVARALGLSSRQLQRTLRAAGVTFSELLRRTRTDAARVLISGTQLSLVEVAFCTGFADAAHLSRVFRRHHEVPPSTFRELVCADLGPTTTSG